MPALHFVFDGFPSPDGPRFIEVETPDGKSLNAGDWQSRPDGLTQLVIENVTRWNPRATLPKDQTVLVTVRKRENGEIIGTFPAYIDDDLSVCDCGSWSPDAGLDGAIFETIAWAPLPSPANPSLESE